MADFSRKRLGHLWSAPDPRVPLLASIFGGTVLPPAPEKQNWFSSVAEWPVDDNDVISDCTSAAVAHAVQQWTVYGKGMSLIMEVEKVRALYAQTKVPDGEGAYLTNVLNFWMTHGVDTGFGTDKILGYASVLSQGLDGARRAVAWFGNAIVGLQLPLSAQTQDVWVPGSAPGGWGGHCVLIVGYDDRYFYFVSWGRIMRMTFAFYAQYCTEAYALLTQDFTKPPGVAPYGLPWNDLIQRMAALKSA